MTEKELIYALALQHAPKIGAITAKKLISHCGSPEAVLKEKKPNLLCVKKKKNVYKWAKHGFATMRLSNKESLWSGNTLTFW